MRGSSPSNDAHDIRARTSLSTPLDRARVAAWRNRDTLLKMALIPPTIGRSHLGTARHLPRRSRSSAVRVPPVEVAGPAPRTPRPLSPGRAGRRRSSNSRSDGAASSELCRQPIFYAAIVAGCDVLRPWSCSRSRPGTRWVLGSRGPSSSSSRSPPRSCFRATDRPQFPSGALWAFVVVALALFGGMLAAVVVFGAEPKVARKSAHTTAQPTASSPRAATTVQVSEKEFKIMLASTSLKAGRITFDVTNVGTVPHDLVIAGTSDRTKLIAPGQTATLTAQLKPGRYELYCSVAGHKQAGMDEKVLVS